MMSVSPSTSMKTMMKMGMSARRVAARSAADCSGWVLVSAMEVARRNEVPSRVTWRYIVWPAWQSSKICDPTP